jgi:myo-inositol-1(or 4)-monophosphatase
MPTQDVSKARDSLEQLVRQAGTLARGHFGQLAVDSVQLKGHLDLVTAADREVERFLTAGLSRLFPEDGVFGEEGSAVTGTSGRTWVIDPIDGTLNFFRGGEHWAVSIGLYREGRPAFGIIHAPALGLMLVGGRDVRPTLNGRPLDPPPTLERSSAVVAVSLNPAFPVADRLAAMKFIMGDAHMAFRNCGSAAISLVQLAAGQVDGYLALGVSTWDVMGGLPILDALGIESTIDWARVELSSKLKFAGGSQAFLDVFAPVVAQLRSG